ncbi:hypothetical protein IPZ58_11850 [Streptomyces roseoverticillatus]|uniref:hypothetical protein n=1 Tax=Streptomyces roseoverticillatus TaxID=66429 RepID=UPI001F29EC52|nr:hypothetical protein [Streptomyces roseoverticillatus]MCF3102277.1 hypothetical protein [Streptomyces roseoverticillatus]
MTLDPATALRLTEALAATGVLLGSLEYLARPHVLADTSLAGWPVLRLRHPRYATGVLGAALSRTVAYPGVLGVLAVRTAAAACLIAAWFHGVVHTALLTIVVVTTVALVLRGLGGGEGADQVLRITFCVLLLTALHPTAATMRLALWFLALQAGLAYFSSGIHKLTSPVWLDGTGLTGVLRTRRYGHWRLGAALAAHPSLARWASRGVSLAETLFPLVLIAPPSWLPAFLGLGVLFHLGCAVVMGLNCFVWAFTALYPAIAYAVLSR